MLTFCLCSQAKRNTCVWQNLKSIAAQLDAFKAAVTEGVQAAFAQSQGFWRCTPLRERQPNRVRVFEMYTDDAAIHGRRI